MSLYVKGLVTLYSRITKLGWFDNEKDEFVFRNVMSDVNKFLSGTLYCRDIYYAKYYG